MLNVHGIILFRPRREVYINRSPAEIQSTILEVRPTLMCAVPRYWEEVYAAINAKIESTPKLMQIFFKGYLLSKEI